MSSKAAARTRAYQQQFNLPSDEILVDEFVCALQQKILLQGKLYISQNFACFYSNIFGNETIKILPASDITGVQLAKILFIPNSIKVFLTYETYFFASFLHRDDAYRLLTKISRGESIAHMGMHADSSAASPEPADEDGSDEGSVRSPNPRSPPGNSKVRHASLLSSNANKLKAEQEKKREEALKAAQKKMQESDESERSRSRSDASEEDDGPPARGKGKATPNKNGRSQPGAKGRRNSEDFDRSSERSDDRSHDDDDYEEDDRDRGGKGGTAGKGGRQRDDSGSDYDERKEDDFDDEDEDRSDRSAESTPPPPRKGGKGGKDGKSNLAAHAANSTFALPRNAELKRQRFYQTDFKTVDPLVIELQKNKFRNKNLGLDRAENKRRLLFQGALKRQGRWSVVDRWCFLFNDFFFFTKYDAKRGTDYQEKQRIYLQYMSVDLRPPSFQLTELGTTKLPNPFRLLDENPSSERHQYVVSSITIQEKYDWGRRLTEAISRWHAQPSNKSTVDRTRVGWYTLFVKGLLPHAVITSDDGLLENLLRTPQKENINDVDQEGNSLLHLCVLNDTPKIIPLLLSNGADIRVKDYDNFTPLHVAVIQGNIECVETLMAAKGMDVGVWHPIHHKEVKVLRERSALWLAAIVHYKTEPAVADQIMRLLVRSVRAMPNFLDERSEKSDMSLLEYCCYNSGMEKIAATLIELGASVDLVNNEGLTPLSQACQAGNTKMVTLLLQSGAQPNMRTHKHGLQSPLFYCKGSQSHALDCAKEVVNYGGRWNDIKNKDGTRVKELFPSISAQNALKAAEDNWLNQKPSHVENSVDPMKPPANSMPANNRHDFESCCLCQMEFTLVNKREYCRRCGWNICGPCSTKRMTFKGKGKKAAGKERVCDGCFNLVYHRKKSAAGKKGAAAPVSRDEEVSDQEEGVPRGAKAGMNGKSPQRTASKRQINSDESEHSDEDEGKRPPPAKSTPNKNTRPDSDESDRSESELSDSEIDSDAEAKNAIADAKRNEAAKTPTSFGGRLLAKLSFGGKKDDPKKVDPSAAKKEAEKHAALSKKKGRDSEEEDDNFDEKSRKGVPSRKGAPSQRRDDSDEEEGRNGRNSRFTSPNKGRRDDDSEEEEPRGGRKSTNAASRRGRSPSEDEDEDDGGGSQHTDSDHRTDDDDDKPKKKDNIFKRGFKSAVGGVKSAGAAVGGAMSSVGRGVSKFANTVQDKVTAVAVPMVRSIKRSPRSDEDEPEEDEEEDDPVAASKARRKEAARERVKQKYGDRDDDDEDDEEEAPRSKGANNKASATASRVSDAKKQAQRNQDLMAQLENRGTEVEDEGEEFQSLASKLKAKSKGRR